MSLSERRQFRRTRLRLRIGRLDGLCPAGEGGLWTVDLSAGGMVFSAPFATPPAAGTAVSFELSVPPGEGYSASAGTVRGCGKVVRAVPVRGDALSVAVQFTKPLALEF